MIYYKTYESPVGLLYVSCENGEITGLWPENDRYYPEDFKSPMENLDIIFADFETFLNYDESELELANATIDLAFGWLDRYFSNKQPNPSELPFRLKGSTFQMEVWNELLDIEYGQVITYGDIAKSLAAKRGIKRMAAQAVGGAVGKNPISIIVPCHRVVGSNGNLTGYGGGLDMKISLLESEGVDMSKLYRPKKGTAL